MPKVGKVPAVFDKDKYYNTIDLYYNQKEKFHVKDLPEDFCKITDFVPSRWATEEQISGALRMAIIKYNEAKTAQRKVIVYEIKSSSMLRLNKTGDRHGSYSGTKPGISPIIGSSQYNTLDATVEFEYQIMLEINQGGLRYYKYELNGDIGFEVTHVSQSTHKQIVEWTAERELFFESINTSLSTLLQRFSSFFSGDKDQVLLKIDQAAGDIKLLN